MNTELSEKSGSSYTSRQMLDLKGIVRQKASGQVFCGLLSQGKPVNSSAGTADYLLVATTLGNTINVPFE